MFCIFCLFSQTVLESWSLMMASPGQFIYSCHFPSKQTKTCRLDGRERKTDRNRERESLLRRHLDSLFYLVRSTFSCRSLFLSFLFFPPACEMHVCTHMHTRARAHTQALAVRYDWECVHGQNKGIFLWLLHNCFDPYQEHDVYSICCVTPPSSPASPSSLSPPDPILLGTHT